MLPKTQRLPYPEQTKVRKHGKHVHTPELELVFVSTTNKSRWTILMPKKVAALATKRNRIKRLLAEAIFALSPTLKFSTDSIIRVKKDISTWKALRVKELLISLSGKAINRSCLT